MIQHDLRLNILGSPVVSPPATTVARQDMCHSGALKPIMHTEWDFFRPRWMNAFAKLLTYQKEGCWNWNWIITFIQHVYCPSPHGEKPVEIEIGQSLFFLILATCSSYSAKVHFTHCPFLFAARAVLSGTWYESCYNSCKRLEENNGLLFFSSPIQSTSIPLPQCSWAWSTQT